MIEQNPITAREVTIGLFVGYKVICDTRTDPDPDSPDGTTLTHMSWMCSTAIEHCHTWPEDKLNRWLGFIQGVLIMKRLITTEAARNSSRILYHAAYHVQGIAIPKTLSPKD